jgi:hypothetical protein
MPHVNTELMQKTKEVHTSRRWRIARFDISVNCMDSEPQLGGRSGQLERCTEQAGTSIVFTIRNTLPYLLVLSFILGNLLQWYEFSSGIRYVFIFGPEI